MGLGAAMICSLPNGRNEPGNWCCISARYQASESRGASIRGLVGVDHVAPEDHRLQVQAATVGEHPGEVGEQIAVDLVLAPGPELLGRAEVLEGAEAGERVERPKVSRSTARASSIRASRPLRRQASA